MFILITSFIFLIKTGGIMKKSRIFLISTIFLGSFFFQNISCMEDEGFIGEDLKGEIARHFNPTEKQKKQIKDRRTYDAWKTNKIEDICDNLPLVSILSEDFSNDDIVLNLSKKNNPEVKITTEVVADIIKSLDPEITQIINVLNLSGNGLTRLPKEIVRFKLKKLDLTGNVLKNDKGLYSLDSFFKILRDKNTEIVILGIGNK